MIFYSPSVITAIVAASSHGHGGGTVVETISCEPPRLCDGGIADMSTSYFAVAETNEDKVHVSFSGGNRRQQQVPYQRTASTTTISNQYDEVIAKYPPPSRSQDLVDSTHRSFAYSPALQSLRGKY